MSLIPRNKLFIVTSALNATMGAITLEERLQQTIQGLKSLRESVPDSIILFVDGSPQKIEENKILKISNLVDFVADFSTDEIVNRFAKQNNKSEAECALLIKTLLLLKQEPSMMRLLHSVNRIFKLSARTDFLDNFNVYEHDVWGKYVFKKRIPTWITDSRNEFATDLLITRLFSFCPSLIDDYLATLSSNIGIITQTKIDTEHAHFLNINKELLVEIDKIHCQGIVATTKTLEVY